MGTKPGCSILSIGLLIFNPQTGQQLAEYYQELVPNGTLDWDTLRWWAKQDAKPPLDGQTGLDVVQDDLQQLWGEWRPVAIWANGANADFKWIRSAMGVPWTFRDERCLRTVAALYPHTVRPPDQHSHNALQDCIWQAKLLHNIYKETGWST